MDKKKNYYKYLNISPLERQWGTYVTTVGYAHVDPNDRYPTAEHPKSHLLTWNRGRILNDFYVIFISKGRGVFASDLTEAEEVEAGTCFFLFPGVLHRYRPDPKVGWEEYWVGFNGANIEHMMKSGLFQADAPFVEIGLNKDVLVLYRNMIETVQSSLVGYPQQLAALTMQMLGIINTVARSHHHHNNPVEKLIAKAKFIIQESFENSLDMEQLASELPMGYSSFRKAFKALTGESPNQYHLNIRLDRAKNLLTTTSLNISEIAMQTGFETVYYFSKLFKRKNGVSPLSFRKHGAFEE